MIVKPNAKHQAFRDALVEVLRRHGHSLSALEMLALSAHLVGQLIAMQDQRRVTPTMALEIVSKNIEQGNQEVLDGLISPLGAA